MADQEQQIRFGAQTKELTAAIENIKSQLEGLREFATGMTEKLSELFAAEKLVEFTKSMGELGEQTERLALTLGVSTESVGELSGLAKLTGTNVESLAMSLERMSLNVQRAASDAFSPAAEAMRVLHLNAKDLIGLPADKYFEKLADAVSKFNPSLKLTNALQELGGRGVAQLVPTLIQGSEAYKHFGQAIADTGSKLSEAATKGMVETQHGLVLLGSSIQGAGTAVFDAFKPAIDGVVRSLIDLAQCAVVPQGDRGRRRAQGCHGRACHRGQDRERGVRVAGLAVRSLGGGQQFQARPGRQYAGRGRAGEQEPGGNRREVESHHGHHIRCRGGGRAWSRA
jgi:hypothetical protein